MWLQKERNGMDGRWGTCIESLQWCGHVEDEDQLLYWYEGVT